MDTTRLVLERSEFLPIIVDGVEIDDAPIWIEVIAEVCVGDTRGTGGRKNEIEISWIRAKYYVTLDLDICQEALGHSNTEFQIKAEQIVRRHPDFLELLQEEFDNIFES